MTTQVEPDTSCTACGAYVSEDAGHCDRCGEMSPTQTLGRHVVKPRPTPTALSQAEEDYGPEPEFKDRVIDTECKPCPRCGVAFEMGETARVWGSRGAWSRYHLACWPWNS